jgi:flagellar biosynthesis/type III secretory pathway chaperone
MHDPVSDLLRIVREEINLYRDLVEHARRKTALLVQGSVDAILESNKIEESFNSKLRALEMEMARLCQELSRTFQIPREEFTLMKLAESIEQPFALEIRSQTTLFRNIVRQLKSVNQRNRTLIEKSLHYSRGLLAIFFNASGSYRQNGMFEQIPSIQPTFSQRA